MCAHDFRSLLTTDQPLPIIGRRCIYRGTEHRWAKGITVAIAAVYRPTDTEEYELLCDDEALGSLRADDRIEFHPRIEEGGVLRWSWITSDAGPEDLEPMAPEELENVADLVDGVVLDIDERFLF